MISIQKHILLINFLTVTIFYQVMVNKILPLVVASLAISLYLNHQQLQDHFLLDWLEMKELFLVLELQCHYRFNLLMHPRESRSSLFLFLCPLEHLLFLLVHTRRFLLLISSRDINKILSRCHNSNTNHTLSTCLCRLQICNNYNLHPMYPCSLICIYLALHKCPLMACLHQSHLPCPDLYLHHCLVQWYDIVLQSFFFFP